MRQWSYLINTHHQVLRWLGRVAEMVSKMPSASMIGAADMYEGCRYDDPGAEVLRYEECPFRHTEALMATRKDRKPCALKALIVDRVPSPHSLTQPGAETDHENGGYPRAKVAIVLIVPLTGRHAVEKEGRGAGVG